MTDASDARGIEAVLRAAPGAIDAQVALHRRFRDPLTGATSQAAGAVLLLVDDRADRVALDARARALVHAVAPEVTPQVIVTLAGHRAELASVGPFTVEASSKRPLIGALVGLLAAVALLAGYVAWRDRPA